MTHIIDFLSEVGVAAHRSDVGQDYARRHGVRSAANLAVTTDEIAGLIAQHLWPRITGKVVVDLGGGVGLLGMHMAAIAKKVFVIEANPNWALGYAELFQTKPANLTFCWGAAQELVGQLKADAAVVATHTDVAGMTALAAEFAPTVIDIFGELIDRNPQGFDEWARNARMTS